MPVPQSDVAEGASRGYLWRTFDKFFVETGEQDAT
jgi:hypothetical protein